MNLETSRALSGVKVVEFTNWIAGPVLGKLLAANGATVLKAESFDRPDGARHAGPALDASEPFINYNAGKLSVMCNPKQPWGSKVARRLIEWADVFIANYRPKALERLGVAPEQCMKLNPRLVYVHLTAQGVTGPHKDHPAFGLFLQALSGITGLTGWPDQEPMGPGTDYSDFASPPVALVALLAALEHREKAGAGTFLDISEYEATISLLGPSITTLANGGPELTRSGNDDPDRFPHGIFPCRGDDAWCAISIDDDADWANLATIIGLTELKHLGLSDRRERTDEINQAVSAWTAARPKSEVADTLRDHGLDAAPVNTVSDLETDSAIRSSQFYEDIGRHPVIGASFPYDGSPARFERLDNSIPQHAPSLGEHTAYVASELLHFSDDEVDQILLESVARTP